MTEEPTEWAEKYRPKNLTEVAGHRTIINDLVSWANKWETGVPKDKALIFYGKPGVGKTSAAYALAYQMGWDVIELNASDQRTAGIIQKIAGSASRMGTFDGTSGRRLIILDEADNLHGNYDRGGARAIINVVKGTSQPVILIANEFYQMDPALRLACKPVQFRTINSTTIVSALKAICKNEGIMVGIGVIDTIADNANGDLRSAINDLQAMSIGKHELEVDDIITAPRDVKETVFKLMDHVFKAADMRSAQQAAWQVDESPDNLINWIDENLPIGYKDAHDMAAGYFQLARADQFLGRVRRRQNYGLWRYASLLMTGGVSAVRTHSHSGYNKYQAPQFWRKLGQTRAKRNIRDSLAGKIGGICHVSGAYARTDLIWFFKHLMKSKVHSVGLAAELKLDPDEIAFLMDTKPTTKKVGKIYDEAQQLMKDEIEHDIEVFGGFGQEKTEKKQVNSLLEFNGTKGNGGTEGTDEKDGIKGTGGTEVIDKTDVNHTDVDNVDSVAKEEKSQSSLFDF